MARKKLKPQGIRRKIIGVDIIGKKAVVYLSCNSHVHMVKMPAAYYERRAKTGMARCKICGGGNG